MSKSEFRQKCIELRRRDFTLGEIVRVLGRPKTSVFFHIRNLRLSRERTREIRDMHTARINQYNRSRKGKSKQPFREFRQWNERTVALVAHLLFDGELRPTSCIYNNRNQALIHRVKHLMKYIYDYKPNELSRNGVMRISYHNVALAKYLADKSQQLLKDIDTLPRKLKRVFLKAFYDDEGCMDFNGVIERSGDTDTIMGYWKLSIGSSMNLQSIQRFRDSMKSRSVAERILKSLHGRLIFPQVCASTASAPTAFGNSHLKSEKFYGER